MENLGNSRKDWRILEETGKMWGKLEKCGEIGKCPGKLGKFGEIPHARVNYKSSACIDSVILFLVIEVCSLSTFV